MAHECKSNPVRAVQAAQPASGAAGARRGSLEARACVARRHSQLMQGLPILIGCKGTAWRLCRRRNLHQAQGSMQGAARRSANSVRGGGAHHAQFSAPQLFAPCLAFLPYCSRASPSLHKPRSSAASTQGDLAASSGSPQIHAPTTHSSGQRATRCRRQRCARQPTPAKPPPPCVGVALDARRSASGQHLTLHASH